MDILFNNDDFVFSHRVGGILIRNRKILLQRPKNDDIPLDGVFHGYDELANERIDLDFCWVPLDELKNGVKVYPLELIPYIIEPRKEIVHFVSKQI